MTTATKQRVKRQAREVYLRYTRGGVLAGVWDDGPESDDLFHGECCRKILFVEVLPPKRRGGRGKK